MNKLYLPTYTDNGYILKCHLIKDEALTDAYIIRAPNSTTSRTVHMPTATG